MLSIVKCVLILFSYPWNSLRNLLSASIYIHIIFVSPCVADRFFYEVEIPISLKKRTYPFPHGIFRRAWHGMALETFEWKESNNTKKTNVSTCYGFWTYRTICEQVRTGIIYVAFFYYLFWRLKEKIKLKNKKNVNQKIQKKNENMQWNNWRMNI